MINPGLYWRTIKHLKQTQIKNRLTRKFKSQLNISANYLLTEAVGHVQLQAFPPAKTTLIFPTTFQFLNKEKTFKSQIDWNDNEFGKLWTYHLNYLQCLLQEDINQTKGLKLIHDYIHQYDHIKDGKDPYPTSLRLIHVIKFMANHRVADMNIDIWIGKQSLVLKQSLEYHLLGNHLLENGFALLFAAYHLKDSEILSWATRIVQEQLEEQILSDGAHFELSPLYHCIIFSRVLDAYNLIVSNPDFPSQLKGLLSNKASLMFNWLNRILINGEVPVVNDTFDVSKTDITKLMQYAYALNINLTNVALGDSGYRYLMSDDLSCLFDVGKIGPDYIPGHAHADTLQFLLWVKNHPVIVDTGVSTYEANSRREFERSTAAHNTVEINHLDSSEVWSSFRVGDRATIIILEETPQSITAAHDGYRHLDAIHKRTISITENGLMIEDNISSSKSYPCVAQLHFHPDQNATLSKNKIQLKSCTINIEQADQIKLTACELATGYNKTRPSLKAEIHFTHSLVTRINTRTTQ